MSRTGTMGRKLGLVISRKLDSDRHFSPTANFDFRNALYQCRLCLRIFPNYKSAITQHSRCNLWSCSFLTGFKSALYAHDISHLACCYCERNLGTANKGDSLYTTKREQHIASHNFRGCMQTKHFSFEAFREHIQKFHGAQKTDTDSVGFMILRKECMRSAPSQFDHISKESYDKAKASRHSQNNRVNVLKRKFAPKMLNGKMRRVKRILSESLKSRRIRSRKPAIPKT